SVLQRRADLGRQGLISVALCCGPDGKLRGTPHVVALGLPATAASAAEPDPATGAETTGAETTGAETTGVETIRAAHSEANGSDEQTLLDAALANEANMHGPNGLLARLGRELAIEWRSLQRAAERGSTSKTANERPWISGIGFVSIQTGALELQVESFVQRWVDVQLRQRPLVAVHVQRLTEAE